MMWYRFFIMVSFVMLVNSSLGWSYPRSLALDEPITSMSPILIDEEIPASEAFPRASPPSRPSEPAELAEAPKAPAKAPSFFERVKGFFGKVTGFIEPLKPIADAFVKETGATDLGSKVKEIFNGYYDLTVQADKDYKAKQQARIDSGEQHGPIMSTLLKGWDLTTTAVIPSFVYSMKTWGWPLIKAVAGMPTVPAKEAEPAPKQATAIV